MSDADTRFKDPTTGNKCPAVWKDAAGIVHRAVGSYILPYIRLLWTACGKKDIPADSAWLQNSGDDITCPDCQSIAKCPRCGELFPDETDIDMVQADGCRDFYCPVNGT